MTRPVTVGATPDGVALTITPEVMTGILAEIVERWRDLEEPLRTANVRQMIAAQYRAADDAQIADQHREHAEDSILAALDELGWSAGYRIDFDSAGTQALASDLLAARMPSLQRGAS